MGNFRGRGPRDEDVFPTFQTRAQLAHILTHPPPNAVARDGVAHLPGDGEADFQLPPLQMNQSEIAGGVGLSPAIDEAIIAVIAQRRGKLSGPRVAERVPSMVD